MVVPWEFPSLFANLCKNQPYRPRESPHPPSQKKKFWNRYVDDSFVMVKKDCVPEFHDKLNSIDPMISFTMEKENNQQISFLDTIVSIKNSFIVIDVFR